MLCPVDLEPCERPQCRRGQCARGDAAPLAICWECGAVEADGVVAGLCVACVAAYAAEATATEG